MIKDPWLKALVILMVGIAAFYLTALLWDALVKFSDVVLIFFLAWILAFILDPIVTALHRATHLPRAVAVGLTYLLLSIALTAGIIVLIPALITQIEQVASQLPTYTEQIALLLQNAEREFAVRGIRVDLAQALDYPEMAERLRPLAAQMLTNALGLATGVATLLGQTIIVVIISVYITLDWDRLALGMTGVVPPRLKPGLEFLFESVHRAFAGFMRGQVVQGLVNAVGIAAIMASLGLDYVLLASVVGGLITILPFFGSPLSIVFPLVVTYFSQPGWFWAALLALIILQQLVVNIIGPRVMHHTVGLHPLLVFAAVLLGLNLAGLWGAIFGVPVLAVFANMLAFYREALARRGVAAPLEVPHERPAPEPRRSPKPRASVSR